MVIKPYLFILVAFFTLAKSAAQNPEDYTFFDDLIGLKTTKLHNGLHYYNAFKTTEDRHNFFMSPSYIAGSVDYDGSSFYNVDLKYDLYKDVLVSKAEGNTNFVDVQLIPEKVSSFTVHDRHFINTHSLNPKNNAVGGFVELAFSGKQVSFLIKRWKDASKTIEYRTVTHLFTEKSTYYLFYDGMIRKVTSPKSLVKHFPEHKKAIRSFISNPRNKLPNGASKEDVLINIIAYIDSLLATNIKLDQ
ncbi:hypothetical protein [Flagellimonas sp.]|uniref:hypothetical protein n=1 Tax=Flagellimonas sp. TaxID=2058762 RepID=UPI003B59429B